MHIPSGYTYEQVHETISLIVSRISGRYTFPGYTDKDMAQEAYILCMEALPRYIPGVHPLENFLSANLSNRLKNFVRDNYFTTSDNQDRMKLMKSEQLENDFTIVDGKLDGERHEEYFDYKDMAKIIDIHIPVSMRMDYLKMLTDAYVPKKRREEITIIIKEILSEHNYYAETGQDLED
jgi:hypothetical protein